MGYALWIANAMRDTNLPVAFVPGWETRGKETFAPRGGVVHHDGYKANVPTANAVSLMVNGRSDLPGPLCHIWLDDDNNATPVAGDPAVYVIAAGRANHAGAGGWNGLSGNTMVWGIEARNSGGPGDPWSPAMLDAYYRVCAALAHHAGHGPEMIAGHKEWAPRRKPDPQIIDMNDFRGRVKGLLGNIPAPGGGVVSSPVLPPSEVVDDQAGRLLMYFAASYDRNGGPGGWPTLKVGSSGDFVRMVQGTARSLSGKPGAIDGVYGPATQQAIADIQSIARRGNPQITVDGICGFQTYQVLRFMVAVAAQQKAAA